ncbi:MAG: hypothetical protein U0931_03890 [Vulcanimicrobiota bacterium]
MSTDTVSFPWQSAIQELALTRSRQDWASSLEYLAGQLAEAETCTFLTWREPRWFRPATGDSVEAPDQTLVGAAWLNVEATSKSSNAGELWTGRAAAAPCWALPMRSFGRVIGILTLEKVAAPPSLEEWTSMLDLMAHSWETVGRLEDHNAYQDQTELLFVKALESLPGFHAGHVQRVARTAFELGCLLDLSAFQRQRLLRAGRYHDVGMLLNPSDHAAAGAHYLREGKVHADLAPLVENSHTPYSEELGLGLEEWTLALAEHFSEYREAQKDEQADVVAQRFVVQHGKRHNPAVLDALIGLSVSGKLDEIN